MEQKYEARTSTTITRGWEVVEHVGRVDHYLAQGVEEAEAKIIAWALNAMAAGCRLYRATRPHTDQIVAYDFDGQVSHRIEPATMPDRTEAMARPEEARRTGVEILNWDASYGGFLMRASRLNAPPRFRAFCMDPLCSPGGWFGPVQERRWMAANDRRLHEMERVDHHPEAGR